MKKSISGLVLLLVLLLAGCSAKKTDTVTVRVAALKGPTGMGIAYLNQQADAGKTQGKYAIQYAGSADDITGGLISGELDIAAVPVNLASVLYNKTEGAVKAAAINTLGVLYVVEKGDTVHSMQDLAGRKVLGAGQGSTPEYIMDFLLAQNGLSDSVEVEYVSEHAETVTRLASGDADLILVPEPFVTTALMKVEGARIAVDLTQAWSQVSDAELVQGCIVVRSAFAQEHPEALRTFLQEYAGSAAYTVENPAEAAKCIEAYGILPSAAVAEATIPNANIVCITGAEMEQLMNDMLQVLFDANPKSVGGSLPGAALYIK